MFIVDSIHSTGAPAMKSCMSAVPRMVGTKTVAVEAMNSGKTLSAKTSGLGGVAPNSTEAY